MKTSFILAAAVTATVATTAVEAKNSSPAEYRGYENCIEAADEQSHGLVTKRTYLISKDNEVTNYFVNGSRWEDGDRAQVRITCETTKAGRELLSTVIEPGKWVQERGVVRVELAAN